MLSGFFCNKVGCCKMQLTNMAKVSVMEKESDKCACAPLPNYNAVVIKQTLKEITACHILTSLP